MLYISMQSTSYIRNVPIIDSFATAYQNPPFPIVRDEHAESRNQHQLAAKYTSGRSKEIVAASSNDIARHPEDTLRAINKI